MQAAAVFACPFDPGHAPFVHMPSLAFEPTRAAGLARLDAFAPRAGVPYARGRNHDRGDADAQAVSLLSPYLRHRLLTEHEVLQRVQAEHPDDALQAFTQQVMWRTYFKGWLEQRPDVWRRFVCGRDEALDEVRNDAGRSRNLAAAEEGRTGIDGFDHWARELRDTGYLHNHARMWFASIWIFTLRLPWSLGADFFLRELVDADAASNTLSWRWVAGLHTPGKTYLATADNIAHCTGGRFRPRGLATHAEALTEPPLPAAVLPDAYPHPAESKPSLLLLTGEDLHPESLFGPGSDVRGALVCERVGGADAWPWGPRAADFVDAAGHDAGRRAEAHFDTTAEVLHGLDPAAVAAVAERVGARRVITAHAPVGPVADALSRLKAQLHGHGLPLLFVQREWDRRFWPHATRGYFAFKRELPALLAESALSGRA